MRVRAAERWSVLIAVVVTVVIAVGQITAGSSAAQAIAGMSIVSATSPVSESDPYIEVVVQPGNQVYNGPVQLRVRPAGVSATGGLDFDDTIQTLSWALAEYSEKTVQIPIVNDTLVEDPETLSVILDAVVGMLATDAPTFASVTITDNDVLLVTVTPTVTPLPPDTPTSTVTPTVTPPPPDTPTSTATALPPTPSDTPTPVPSTATPTPADTPTGVPSTATPTPADTPTGVPSTATPTPADTPTGVPSTATPTPADTPTAAPAAPTPTPADTPTPIPTAAAAPTPTPADTPTPLAVVLLPTPVVLNASISGAAPPGTAVEVVGPDGAVYRTVVGAGGTWQFNVTGDGAAQVTVGGQLVGQYTVGNAAAAATATLAPTVAVASATSVPTGTSTGAALAVTGIDRSGLVLIGIVWTMTGLFIMGLRRRADADSTSA